MSASREPIELTFGAQSFTVRPLTIGQVEAISALVESGAVGGGGISQAVKIVTIAMARDHAQTKIEDLETAAPEIIAAMTDVLRLGGFMPKPGEAPAAAETAQA